MENRNYHFVWNGRRVEVPADLYHAFKHVDAKKLLEARFGRVRQVRRRMGMDKYRNKRWIVISVPGDLYELAEEGAKLRGCTPEEFVIKAVERASEEEERK